MSSTALLSVASVTVFMVAVGSLIGFVGFALKVAVEDGPTSANRKPIGRHIGKIAALLLSGICSFIVLGAMGVTGLDAVRERSSIADREARSTRYEECLARTTAEVCEVHWIRLPKPTKDGGGGPSLVIAPDGKIGMGVGL